MVSITFHGGVNEIGGNKILIDDKGTKIWIDFGMSFGQYQKYFEEFMKPRITTGLKDYIAMGLVPDVKGIYAPDLLQLAGKKEEEPEYDAILVSHAHDDHIKYVSFLHPKIPVYCSETCLGIRQSLEGSATGTLENRIVSYKDRVTEEEVTREMRTFSGKSFSVNGIEIQPINVDHSIPGAFGFIIYTSQGPIVYTGDVRLHGTQGWMTKEFVEKVSEEKPIIALTEGTRVNDTEKENESEQLVREKIIIETRKTKGLVVVDYSFKDIDRFRTLLDAAKNSGRKLVISTKAAELYDAYSSMLGTPKITDESILIHIKKKSKPQTWEKRFLDFPNAITAEEMGKRQSELILGFNQWSLNEMIDIQPKSALYIRSMSEPYNEEMELDEKRLDNWIDFFGMRKERAHCSGHAPGRDILDIVKGINAKKIVPIHTEHPEAFTKLGKVEMPKVSGSIEI